MSGIIPRGLFVVIEGVDRCGKTTQAKLLAAELNTVTGNEPFSVGFPDRKTAVGVALSKYLNTGLELEEHAVHLLFTANRWELAAKIEKALADGKCVVCDRYSYSGIVYSTSKGCPPDWEWCRRMETNLPQPDLILCLSPDKVEELTSRSGFGTERFETTEFQDRVLCNYLRLSNEMESERRKRGDSTSMTKGKWYWIEAGGKGADDVHKCIMGTVRPILVEMGLADAKEDSG